MLPYMVFLFSNNFLNYLIVLLNCIEKGRRNFVIQTKEISTQVSQSNIQKEPRVCSEVPISLQLGQKYL